MKNKLLLGAKELTQNFYENVFWDQSFICEAESLSEKLRMYLIATNIFNDTLEEAGIKFEPLDNWPILRGLEILEESLESITTLMDNGSAYEDSGLPTKLFEELCENSLNELEEISWS